MSLDSFVRSSRPSPKPICTSQPIKDRGSMFVAFVYAATSPAEAHTIIKHVKNVVHASNPASHDMMAYRTVCLKSGHSGLSGPDDFEVKGGSEDDGERFGGSRILKVMQKEGVLDVVVVVSRWYGGTLLGPIRFTHIENCAQEVCVRFRITEELEGHVKRLQSLDRTLEDLRAKHAGGNCATHSKAQDYSTLVASLDLEKAHRLIKAREYSIKSMQTILTKKSQETLPSGNNKHGV